MSALAQGAGDKLEVSMGTCTDCGNEWSISAAENAWWEKRIALQGFVMPKRCQSCREARKKGMLLRSESRTFRLSDRLRAFRSLRSGNENIIMTDTTFAQLDVEIQSLIKHAEKLERYRHGRGDKKKNETKGSVEQTTKG
jgi:hypothetical protein